ncbi:helix-turn-helix domain-containing protein [Polaromonas sp.]|uniref:helix-turn-helix domain-containing protein n=1 Tax=Polaromonas sp. TaxID=1869339 RepID=UPI002734145C|nr:helix-turn-helix domain-containing protein [Polaromonas sp.]
MTDRLHKICGRFAVVPMDGQHSVRGGTESTRLGGQDAVIVSQNINRISRDAQCIRRDPGENYFLIFQDHGRAVMCQESTQFQMKPGDVALIDSTKPSDFIYAGLRSQQISVHLPRDEMRLRFGTKIQSTLGILKQDALGLAMRAILVKMLEPANHESGHLKEAFMAVFGSFLHERYGHGVPARLRGNHTLLSAALQQISLRFPDPAFNAVSLATTLNVPPRSLQRLFQSLGETPSRSILNTRLSASHDRLKLQVGSLHTRLVSSVAYGCGFNDLSFFYREFRKKYGVTPGHIVNPC